MVELETEGRHGLLAVFARPLQVRVVASEELLGQLEDAVLVVLVDSEERRENTQGVALSDLLDEVALTLFA